MKSHSQSLNTESFVAARGWQLAVASGVLGWVSFDFFAVVLKVPIKVCAPEKSIVPWP